jgi:hypothetical protein
VAAHQDCRGDEDDWNYLAHKWSGVTAMVDFFGCASFHAVKKADLRIFINDFHSKITTSLGVN